MEEAGSASKEMLTIEFEVHWSATPNDGPFVAPFARPFAKFQWLDGGGGGPWSFCGAQFGYTYLLATNFEPVAFVEQSLYN